MRYKALMCQGGDYSSVTCGDTFSHKRRQRTLSDELSHNSDTILGGEGFIN
ncbi:MAG: hypothetical protein IKL79_00010 [Clostridia bacterium]|nr:hypothetical protein [Clostridia bacterium]